MSDEKKQSLSEKIEDTVEGILRFFVRLFRTTWTIFRRPFACAHILLSADKGDRLYILPLTFLTVGGFIFTLVISVYPFGLLNILDVIWFDEDISKNIFARWSEALSITGLLTAAFPVFLSVTLLASLTSRVFPFGEQRDQFKTLCSYAFGYQTLLFFFMFFASIAFDLVGSAIIGPYRPSETSKVVIDVLTDVLLVVVLLVFLSPLLMPIVMLTTWQFGRFRDERSIRNGVTLVLMPVFAVIGLVIISYAASMPAIFKDKVEDKAPGIALDRIGDDQIKITRNAQGEYSANVQVNLVVDNKPTQNLYVETHYVNIFLAMERDDRPFDSWYSDDVLVQFQKQPVEFIQVAREHAEIFAVSGSIELSEDAVDLIRQKEAGLDGSNDYAFFLVTELSVGSNTYERKIAIDYSQAISGL